MNFRQEDRICRICREGDCGAAAVASGGSGDFGFYFDILLDFSLAPPTADSFRTWKPISFLDGREAGVTNG